MMATKRVDYRKLSQATAQAQEAAERAARLREEAQEAVKAAERAEAEEERLHGVVQALIRGEDVELDAIVELVVMPVDVTAQEEVIEESDEQMAEPITEIAVAGQSEDGVETSGAEIVQLDERRPSPLTVVIEDMTDADADFLPCGNDLLKPEIPLTQHEVAELHRPYLDRVEGAYATRDQLERFEVSRRRHGKGGITHFYQCVMCQKYIESRNCDTFGGLPLCKIDGGKVRRYMVDSGWTSLFIKDGVQVQEAPFAMHLGYAFQLADGRARVDRALDERMTQENLAWEQKRLAELRSDDEPRASVGAEVTGLVPLNEEELAARFGEDSGLGAEALGFDVASGGRRQTARSSGIVNVISQDIEVHFVPVTDEELAMASEERHWTTLMGPFSKLKRNIEERYREDDTAEPNACKRDATWQQVVNELARIHMAWEQKDPRGHQFYKDKIELSKLMDEREAWFAKQDSRIRNGDELLPFPMQDRIAKLQSDSVLLDAVLQWRSRREQQNRSERSDGVKAETAKPKRRTSPKKVKKGEVKPSSGPRKKFKKGQKQK